MTRCSREYVKTAVPQKELTLYFDCQILGDRRQRHGVRYRRKRTTDCKREDQCFMTLIFNGCELDKRCTGKRGRAIHILCDGLVPEIGEYTLTRGRSLLCCLWDSGPSR